MRQRAMSENGVKVPRLMVLDVCPHTHCSRRGTGGVLLQDSVMHVCPVKSCLIRLLDVLHV
jgi:hypothetical protein